MELINLLHKYNIRIEAEPMGKLEPNFLFTYESQGKFMRAYYNLNRMGAEEIEGLLLDDVRYFITFHNLQPRPDDWMPYRRDGEPIEPLDSFN